MYLGAKLRKVIKKNKILKKKVLQKSKKSAKRLFKVHFLPCYGVFEPYFSSMKHQSFALVSVEFIAYNGASEPVGVSTVNAQLVGSSGMGVEGYEVVGDELIVGDGLLAVFHVHHLPRPVHGVWAQWE